MNTTKENMAINWEAYAQRYDMLLNYNPFYKELHEQVLALLQTWELPPGGDLVDLGAGTGNYSIPMAGMFPKTQVWHIDNNPGMNAVAAGKARGLTNFEILHQGIAETDFLPNSLQGLLCINAIYTFPDPQQVLHQMYRWLKPSSQAILVDPGRVMNVLSWKIAIGWHLLKHYGIRKTIDLLNKGKVVSQQNAHIRKLQKNNTYWTHTHEEFCKAIEEVGFQIETSGLCFRGYCDLVVVKKP